ncbi:hypothetical protein [Streptomyces sp. SBT349]|uniref:hypothetical protein n=1 Tax=Streptomyces sp. SBT349 TaxID=1580539 RepID=UPI00066BC3E8|nr:hypothetical protein [Streptomyces sp. SBT349]
MNELLNERELLATWSQGAGRDLWLKVLANPHTDAGAGLARRELADCPSSLEALTANAALVAHLIGCRWYVMRDAIEAGATWQQVADTLHLTVPEALNYYRAAIAEQERHDVPGHDTARARAVLDSHEGDEAR